MNENAASTLFHVKSRTRIACWNARTLGSFSDQCAELLAAISTMKEKHIESPALPRPAGLVMLLQRSFQQLSSILDHPPLQFMVLQ